MKSKVNPDQRSTSVAARSPLEHGRECFQQRAWLAAWQALSLADVEEVLGRLIHHVFFPELWRVRNELTALSQE